MGGGGPSRFTHSGGASSGVSIREAPRLSSEIVFCLLESRAECTSTLAARSKSVGARTRSAASMYSSSPVFVLKYELPVMPCCIGKVPQQMEVLFAFVTLGMTPCTSLYKPCFCHLRRVGAW